MKISSLPTPQHWAPIEQVSNTAAACSRIWAITQATFQGVLGAAVRSKGQARALQGQAVMMGGHKGFVLGRSPSPSSALLPDTLFRSPTRVQQVLRSILLRSTILLGSDDREQNLLLQRSPWKPWAPREWQSWLSTQNCPVECPCTPSPNLISLATKGHSLWSRIACPCILASSCVMGPWTS